MRNYYGVSVMPQSVRRLGLTIPPVERERERESLALIGDVPLGV
jgi:hypothetical protein